MSEVQKPRLIVSFVQLIQCLIALPANPGRSRLRDLVFTIVLKTDANGLWRQIPVIRDMLCADPALDLSELNALKPPTLTEWLEMRELLGPSTRYLPKGIGGARNDGEAQAVTNFYRRFVADGSLPEELRQQMAMLIDSNMRGPWVWESLVDVQAVSDKPGRFRVIYAASHDPEKHLQESFDLASIRRNNDRALVSE